MKYVVSVAETRSFSRSAERLFVTQPTLSQQIARLERELGVTLFDRTTRSVLLTPAGAGFVKEAQTLIESWNRLLDAARHPAGDNPRVVVGLLPILGRTNLVDGISDFTSQHPDIRMEFVVAYSSELFEMLAEGSVDIVIANTLVPPIRGTDGCDVFPLEANPIMVILSTHHPLRDVKHVSVEDLRNEPVILLRAGASVRMCMDQVFKRSRIEPRIVCECDMDSVADLVAANVGVSFLTARVAGLQRNIVALPLHPPVSTQTSIVVRKGRLSEPRIAELKRHIETAFRADPPTRVNEGGTLSTTAAG